MAFLFGMMIIPLALTLSRERLCRNSEEGTRDELFTRSLTTKYP